MYTDYVCIYCDVTIWVRVKVKSGVSTADRWSTVVTCNSTEDKMQEVHKEPYFMQWQHGRKGYKHLNVFQYSFLCDFNK
jgi:hypothetical protein